MLNINLQGQVVNSRVKPAIAPNIEHGLMTHVHGIIVHQTDGPSAKSALDSYSKGSPNGAHFLIDKDGTIYQTIRLHRSLRKRAM